MQRYQILQRLRDRAPNLRRLGATRLFLFGSASRDQATASSDIALFFDFDDPAFSVIDLLNLQDRLSDILQAPADVMTRGSLHHGLRAAIEHSAIHVF
jgi:predicted nucleotidyltransferase